MILVSIDQIDQDPQMQRIKAASHSRLSVFESCKFRAKLAFVDRIPEPPRPLPPGKSEHANDRGTRIHLAAEKFVGGGVELIEELRHFEPELLRLRDLAKQGKVSLEGDWAYDEKWQPVAWMSSDVKMRIKTDVTVFMSSKWAVVVDYKSGKRWGNEVKHAEQMQLYQLGAFVRYPKLERVRVELWYTDQDELHHMTYRRDQGLRFVAGFEKRMRAMFEETEFRPNPNAHSCRFCPFRPSLYPDEAARPCKVGVS